MYSYLLFNWNCTYELNSGGSLNLTGYTWASTNEVNDLFMFYTGGTGLDSLTLQNPTHLGTGALDGFLIDFNPNFQLARSV